MSELTITKTKFANLKKAAKLIKKELNIKHMESLDIAAKREGYDSYRDFEKSYSKNHKQTEKDKMSINDFAKHMLSNICDMPELFCTGSKFLEADKEEIKNQFLRAFEEGVIEKPALRNRNLHRFAFGMDKEHVKKEGYKGLNSEDMNSRISGALLVAMGHFFRSVHYCFTDNRNVHVNFATYMADWLDALSLVKPDSDLYSILRKNFPENDIVIMKNGISVHHGYLD